MPVEIGEPLAYRNQDVQDRLVSTDPATQGNGQIICVIGSNGGVGTTTVAANLTAIASGATPYSTKVKAAPTTLPAGAIASATAIMSTT